MFQTIYMIYQMKILLVYYLKNNAIINEEVNEWKI
jgi:hypothetical protein